MKRRFSAKTIIAMIVATSILSSCQSTGTLDLIKDLEALPEGERIEAYQKKTESNKAPKLLYNLAYHQVEAEDYEGAVETARIALGEDPEFLRMRFLLMLSYREMGREKAYLSTLEEIAERLPSDKEIIELLLDSYKAERDYPRMVETAKQLLKLDPKNDKAINALAYESEYMKDLSGIFNLDEVMKGLPEIKTSEKIGEPEIMDTIRERYVLPFLF